MSSVSSEPSLSSAGGCQLLDFPRFWELYDGKTLSTAKHQTIGENITTLAFERNGGGGYSGVFDGVKFGESPGIPNNGGLAPLPLELQRDLRRG